MDRNNTTRVGISGTLSVALRKESVDRNDFGALGDSFARASLSARRAWIEMYGEHWTVDQTSTSLSARRAWIEIQADKAQLRYIAMSLSARRAWIEIVAMGNFADKGAGRSPQGERG